MKEDNNLDQYRVLPKFIEELNQNIRNIDDKISNIDRGNKNTNQKSNVLKECVDIKNLVKQSVDGLSDILNMKINKNVSNNNIQGSCKNLSGLGFEIIEEEKPEKFNNRMKEKEVTQLNENNYAFNNNKKMRFINCNTNNQAAGINTSSTSNVTSTNPNNTSGNNNLTTENSTRNKKKDIKIISNNKPKLNENILSSIKAEITNENNNIPITNNKISSTRGKNSNINIINGATGSVTPRNVANNPMANNKLNKNIKLLKEKITNTNFMKNSIDTGNNVNDIVLLSNNKKEEIKTTAPSIREMQLDKKRNPSINRRYENEEKKELSRSPVPKNYQLKPKVKNKLNDISNDSEHTASPLLNSSIKKIQPNKPNNYLTENKVAASSEVLTKKSSNKIFKDYTNNISTNNINEFKFNNSPIINKFLNANKDFLNDSTSNTNITSRHNSINILPKEYDINNFIQLSLLYNESNRNLLKDENTKFISEDFTKLLGSLIEIQPKNEEKNSSSAVENVHLRDFDIKKVNYIQRKWRNHKISKFLNIQASTKIDDEKINNELKTKILENLNTNEEFKRIISLVGTAMNMLEKFNKSNKSIINDFVNLSKGGLAEQDQQDIYKNYINQKLKLTAHKKEENSTKNFLLNDTNDNNVKLTNSFSQFDRNLLKIIPEEKEKELNTEKQKIVFTNNYFKKMESSINNQNSRHTKNVLSRSQPLNLSTDKDHKSISITVEQEYSENNVS